VRQPALVVFDLDFTLWDCGGTWCDCLSPPFCLSGSRIHDQTGRHVRLYEDVVRILDHCDRNGIRMALASRTEQPPWARELVELLSITKRFAYAEIYPSSKLKHFAAIRESSGVDYQEMVFFDDEMRNIREVSTLGVNCFHVGDGLTAERFHESLTDFAAGRVCDRD
jgi:magnesium-dependent phosphatase 1